MSYTLKMIEHAQTLKSSTERAQAYNIAKKIKDVNEDYSIAQMMIDDNRSQDGALRNARLLVDAGIGTYKASEKANTFGEYHFPDGSVLK